MFLVNIHFDLEGYKVILSWRRVKLFGLKVGQILALKNREPYLITAHSSSDQYHSLLDSKTMLGQNLILEIIEIANVLLLVGWGKF